MQVIKSCKELGRAPTVGDKVKIVDVRDGKYWNDVGGMDHHLGTIMTVADVIESTSANDYEVYLSESRGEWGQSGWIWFPWMIDGIVLESVEDILEDPETWASGDDLEALLT